MKGTVSEAMRREARRFVDGCYGPWLIGTSNRDGRKFWIIPSRENARRIRKGETPIAHWTALDGKGCTCKGYRRMGVCAHAVAAQLVAEDLAAHDASDDDASIMNETEAIVAANEILADQRARLTSSESGPAWRGRI